MTSSTQRNMAGNMLGNRYMLLSMIAKGGMGEVWKARDRLTGKIVAAKVLRPELSGESLPLNRLRLEAQNTLLVEHPNIASVFDSGEDNGRGWIIMELVEGRPLTDYLRGGQRIAPEYLIPLLIQMAMALGAAAHAGVVHRDIKPANVLIRPNGTVKLTDFGISRTKDQVDLTQAGMVMGTAQYLPPEQALGELATSSGDLYSVGVIAYEACAGRRPFTGKTQVDIAFAHVHEDLPPLPSDVPQELASVIYHLLEKDPQRRPESADALVRELVEAAQALNLSIAAHPLPRPVPVEDEGGATSVARTSAQPVVAPVHHEPVHHLPEEMLAPVDMESASLDRVIPERPALRFTPVRQSPTAPVQEPAPVPRSCEPSSHTIRHAPSPSATHSPTAHAGRPAVRTSSMGVQRVNTGRRPRVSEKVLWESVSHATVQAVDYPSARPVRTDYSRSLVAPPLTRSQKIVRWAIAIVLTIAILVLLTVSARHFLGSGLSSVLPTPTQAAAALPFEGDVAETLDYLEAHHV